VGVVLTSGKYPPGLQSGDEVRIVRLGDGTTPVAPLAVGLVVDSSTSESGGLSGGDGSSTQASLLVPADASDDVIDASGNDRLGLALIRRGVSVDDAQLTVLGDS
jgi:hypothetical protein